MFLVSGIRLLAIGVVTALTVQTGAVAHPKPPRDRLPGRRGVSKPHDQRAHEGPFLGSTSKRVPTVGMAENFKVLDHVWLGGRAPDADVAVFSHGGKTGKYAYVGTWAIGCTGRGVKIVDVGRPRRSKLVATARLRRGEVSYEDPVVMKIGTKDVLAVGVQDCNFSGRGGLALFDVTHPRRPSKLSFLPVKAFLGVHELDLVRRPGGRVIALLAVPFANNRRDFRIVEVTYPRHPKELAEWGVVRDSSLTITAGEGEIKNEFQGIGYDTAYFGHSVRGADQGKTAYVSYWDTGVLKLRIGNLARPRLVGHTTFGAEDDGEAHSMTPLTIGGERYILQNDEDWETLSPPDVTSTETGGKDYPAIEVFGLPTPLLSESGSLSAPVHDAGAGCTANDFEGGDGEIVTFDFHSPFGRKPPCRFSRQLLLAARSNARAVLVNYLGSTRAQVFDFDFSCCPQEIRLELRRNAKDMPVVAVSDLDGLVEAIRSSDDPEAVTVSLDPRTPSWGYLRIFSESGATDVDDDEVLDYEEVGSFFDLAHVRGELRSPPGFWSVHNTEVFGDRAYSSWYGHGVVALDMSDPTEPLKVGQFVPPTDDERTRTLGRGGASTWGVAIDRRTGLIYASDMRTGLWIIKPTGPAAPSG